MIFNLYKNKRAPKSAVPIGNEKNE